MKYKFLNLGIALIAQMLALNSAHSFPDRPINLIVPSPAGSPPT